MNNRLLGRDSFFVLSSPLCVLCASATVQLIAVRLCADEILFWRFREGNYISAEPHRCAERRGAENAEKREEQKISLPFITHYSAVNVI
jgi:hypothetical protein